MHLRRGVPFGSAPRVSLAFVLSAIALAGAARAETDKEACVRAVERAQVARLDGKLRKAREGFVLCARPVCPDAIREDCTRWVGEVDASLPSVVFEAVWADGRDVTGATVLVDGQPLVAANLGRAVPLDPGEHLVRFEVQGAAPVETRNVIREGEKNRILRVTLTPLATSPAVSPPAPASTALVVEPPGPAPAAPPPNLFREVPAERPSRTTRAPVPLGAWLLGGLGLASFGAFAFLGLDGTGRLDAMRSSCGHTCNPSDVTSARNEILAGDIVGFAGLAATGLAAWLFFARPTVTTPAATASP